MQDSGLIPDNIGKYKVLGLLGRGSMGVVYKALDPEIERVVAIKMLRGVFNQSDQGDRNRLGGLRDEARSAGNLRHPNIITVFEVDVVGSNPYIVMDFLEGVALDAIIKSNQPLSTELCVFYLAQAALGLDYAHSKGIVHCDIKPSNLLIEEATQALFILDFGIAKYGSGPGSAEGPVVGTPAYMSPEQILNEPLDGRTDVFSLSIVAFELLTGVRPFPGTSLTSVMSNILRGERVSMHDCAPHLSQRLEPVFQRGLCVDRDKRFQSCTQMITELAEALFLEDPFKFVGGLPRVERPQAIDGGFGQKSLRVNFDSMEVQKRRLVGSANNWLGLVSTGWGLFVMALVFLVFSTTTSTMLYLWVQSLARTIPNQAPVSKSSNLALAVDSSQAVEFFVSLKEQPAAELLQLLNSGAATDAEIVYALRFLGERGVDLVLPIAIKQSLVGSRLVRLEAYRTLAAFPGPQLNEGLHRGLHDASPYLRQMVIRIIGQGLYQSLMPNLILLHHRETSPVVRQEIALTLKKLRQSQT